MVRSRRSSPVAALRHGAACAPTAIPKTCDTLFRCRETPHSDVLSQDTVSPTVRKAVSWRASDVRRPCRQPVPGVLPNADAVHALYRLDRYQVAVTVTVDAAEVVDLLGGVTRSAL